MEFASITDFAFSTSLGLGGRAQLTDATLREALPRLTRLTTLDLSWCTQLTDATLREALPRLTQLTTLSLSWCTQLTDARPLGSLAKLTTLSLRGCTQLTDATLREAIPRLTRLTTLDLSRCAQLTDATLREAIPRLTQLITLDLSWCKQLTDATLREAIPQLTTLDQLTTLILSRCTQLTDARPLGSLTQLTTLDLSWCTQLTDATLREAIPRLTTLTTLDLSGCTQLTDARPLGSLTTLTTLNLNGCAQLTDATLQEAIPRLTTLTTLSLNGCTQLTDARPLGSLAKLTTLSLNGCTQLTDARPLGSLTQLTTLSLNGCTQLTDATLREALPRLTTLTTLSLNGCTQLTDARPLGSLAKLTTLSLDGCVQLTHIVTTGCFKKMLSLNLANCRSLKSFAQFIPLLPHLLHLCVTATRFCDLHPSVCIDAGGNAIEHIRRYIAALGTIRIPDPVLKLFILGNGRVGKTKLLGRLRGLPFESIPEGSTHGVTVTEHSLENGDDLPHPVRLSIWDFGGQEIYHGTHALFLAAPAIYVVMYSGDNENDAEFEDGGFRMKNRRLAYWFDYLRQVANDGGEVTCPVLLVQGKCDKLDLEDTEPPYKPAIGFPQLSQLLHVSTRGHGRGLGSFRDHLREAVIRLLEVYPQPPLPASWDHVRQEVCRLRGPSHRTMTLSDLARLCERHGCPGDESVLRDALHQMGVIFYRTGIFADQIILDQSWAVEAIYTVFTRNEKFQQLVRSKKGRFNRDDLDRYFWHRYPAQDQYTFLSFMRQCDVCFLASGHEFDGSADYIAPDLLAPWGEDEEMFYALQLEIPPWASVTVEYGLLHDGILRAFLSRVGHIAGDRAHYWKFGCHIHDRATGSQACVQAEGNKISMRAWQGDAEHLLLILLKILRDVPVGRSPVINWHSPSGVGFNHRESTNTALDPIAPPHERNLARLGRIVNDNIAKLRQFHIIGREILEKKLSLAKIADILQCEKSNISMILSHLEKHVFSVYYRDKSVKLRVTSKPENRCRLTDRGIEAWEDTRDYLQHHDRPPIE